jgi:hypothetical protein
MIHYGKHSDGELEIKIPACEVAELWHVIDSAPLIQRRTFHGLQAYIEEQFNKELSGKRLVKQKKP